METGSPRGTERRRYNRRVEDRRGGRVVYSRGPIIKVLEVTNFLVAICSVVALIVALTSQSNRLDDIQSSRVHSATDTCYLFRKVVSVASAQQHQQKAGNQFLVTVGLGNCVKFGHNVTKLK